MVIYLFSGVCLLFALASFRGGHSGKSHESCFKNELKHPPMKAMPDADLVGILKSENTNRGFIVFGRVRRKCGLHLRKDAC